MNPAPTRPGRRAGAAVVVALASLALTACSDDGDDAPASDATVAVDEDFPGDALDATCARLEAGVGDDREAVALALFDELSDVADPAIVANTLESAVVDRCPDWADAVTAAVEARS